MVEMELRSDGTVLLVSPSAKPQEHSTNFSRKNFSRKFGSMVFGVVSQARRNAARNLKLHPAATRVPYAISRISLKNQEAIGNKRFLPA
jgi:hypothetical protein